jgi:hypothetical protein
MTWCYRIVWILRPGIWERNILLIFPFCLQVHWLSFKDTKNSMQKTGNTFLSLQRSALTLSSAASSFKPSHVELANKFLLCSRIVVRTSMKHGFVRKQARTPVRVYEYGDEVPSVDTKRPVIKVPTSEQESREQSSSVVFKWVLQYFPIPMQAWATTKALKLIPWLWISRKVGVWRTQ